MNMKKVWIILYFIGSFLPMGAQQPVSKATGNKLSQFMKRKLEWAKKNMSAKYNAAVKKAGQMLTTSPQRKRLEEVVRKCTACKEHEKVVFEGGAGLGIFQNCVMQKCPVLYKEHKQAFKAYNLKLLGIVYGIVFGSLGAFVGLGLGIKALEMTFEDYQEQRDKAEERKKMHPFDKPISPGVEKTLPAPLKPQSPQKGNQTMAKPIQKQEQVKDLISFEEVKK